MLACQSWSKSNGMLVLNDKLLLIFKKKKKFGIIIIYSSTLLVNTMFISVKRTHTHYTVSFYLYSVSDTVKGTE